jgi:tetratricopeptide (TPR) repeat protein
MGRATMVTIFRQVPRAPLFFLFLVSLSMAVTLAHAAGAAGANGSIPDKPPPEVSERYLDQLKESVSLFPYNESLRNKLAQAYDTVGQNQLKQKQFDEAAESFGRAHELFPARLDYGIWRGIALYRGKRYDEAAYELESDRSAGGDNPPLLFYLGLVRYDTGNLAGALDAWDRALALDPANKTVLDLAEKARRESAVESRMEKGYRSMFEISYDEGTQSDLADAVLKALESAYNRVGADLFLYPSVRTPVILYTRKDYRNLTASPEWSGGLYDGKIRLPIGGAAEITPMLRGVLFHEYTHVVVRELTRGNCPSWLNEGLAEVEGRKEYDQPLTALEGAVKTGAFLPFTSLEKSLASLSGKEALLAYQQGYAMVRYLISAYGWHKVREILVNLGTGMTIEAAIARTFADYGLDYQGIVQEWQAQVQKEYGGR